VPESAHPPPVYSELYDRNRGQNLEDNHGMMDLQSKQLMERMNRAVSQEKLENSNINHTQSIKDADIPSFDDKFNGTIVERDHNHG
jgi:hypothetical protein